MYRVFPGIDMVEILDFPTIRLDRLCLIQTIQNIKFFKDQFSSEEEYQQRLQKYQGALAFLDSHLNISPT